MKVEDILEELEIELNLIALDLVSELSKEPQNIQVLSELKNQISNLEKETPTLDMIRNSAQKDNIDYISNVFLKLINASQEKYLTEILLSKISTPIRTQMLKDFILEYDKISNVSLRMILNQLKDSDIKKFYQKYFNTLPQELVGKENGIRLILILNDFQFIDPQNFIVQQQDSSENHSILSLFYKNKWEWPGQFWLLYDQISIP